MAEDNLYGRLGNVSDASTGYYDALANAQVSGCNSSVMAVSVQAGRLDFCVAGECMAAPGLTAWQAGRQAGRTVCRSAAGRVEQAAAAAQRLS